MVRGGGLISGISVFLWSDIEYTNGPIIRPRSTHVHPSTHPRTACFTAHVSKLEAATARRQRAAQEAELRGMGSLVAGSEHLVRVFFLNGSHRTVGFDRCVCVFGGGLCDR